MNRILDILLVSFSLMILIVPLIVIGAWVYSDSPGGAIYWSNRVGRHNRIFKMAKFRSMRIDTPQVATHLLDDPEKYLTPVGAFLRKTSLDELPQLWCVLKGDMSFVGPRPALYNQQDLIDLRSEKRVHELRPGITGWAQVNGRDTISISKKVELDEEYLLRRSLLFDLKILWLTIAKMVNRDEITH